MQQSRIFFYVINRAIEARYDHKDKDPTTTAPRPTAPRGTPPNDVEPPPPGEALTQMTQPAHGLSPRRSPRKRKRRTLLPGIDFSMAQHRPRKKRPPVTKKRHLGKRTARAARAGATQPAPLSPPRRPRTEADRKRQFRKRMRAIAHIPCRRRKKTKLACGKILGKRTKRNVHINPSSLFPPPRKRRIIIIDSETEADNNNFSESP